MKKQIQIFKPGKHTASNGAALSFTEADLQASASAYDPAKHEAPITIGHPEHDKPAYGWVKSLAYADGLEAEPQQVDPAFAEMHAAGRFKKVSASFYTPDSPSNPVPGVYYLRHVAFLGAQPPAVKGLRSPEFAEKEEGVIEFADYDDITVAALFRRLRDWMIGEKGLDVADNIIPDYQVSSLEQSALAEDNDQAGASPLAQFTEKGSDQVTPEQKAALEAENASLKQQVSEGVARDKAAKTAARHAEHTNFAEGLVKDGKLLPVQKDVAIATLDFMAGQETVVEFGEGDAKKPLADAFKGLLQALPKQVVFAEVGAEDGKTAIAVAAFSTAPGYTVDADKMATHLKALSYAETNKCDYVTAVKAVEKA